MKEGTEKNQGKEARGPKPKKPIIKRFWYLWVILTIIIVTIATALIYRKSVAPKVLPPDKEQAKEKINTSGWLVYRNEKAKFELKYPPNNWKIEVLKTETPETSRAPGFRYCGNAEGNAWLGFYTYDLTLDPDTKLESLFKVLDLEKMLNQKYIALDGERAMDTLFVRQRYTTPEEFIDVIHKSRPYRIFLAQEPTQKCATDTSRIGTYRELQAAILSTFKFID